MVEIGTKVTAKRQTGLLGHSRHHLVCDLHWLTVICYDETHVESLRGLTS